MRACLRNRDENDLYYTIEKCRVGAGRTIWRWEVRRRGDEAPLIASLSLQSRTAAEQDAIKAIRQHNAADTRVKPRLLG
jgi:hypothetical protein